ncbi:MAG: MiaB/RimO family radical SAM methylthiotransferase [Sphingomonadales bacterium]|nr:MiaB/RimO family radical SAM methylthiotransferase [Sphingomonadales bacterium]
MSVEVINFGCRLNLAEGEAIRKRMADQGDLIVVNSCAVTSEAERQARQAIRRAAKRRPEARIIVTGCAAETNAAMFSAMPEVSGILGNRAKRGESYTPAVSGENHARAFVEVQNGCDHSCTFCIIPQGRGESRSIPAGAVIKTIQEATDRGQQEVILTGVDLTSYGPDLPGQPSLGSLVERILKHVPALPRLRLSSLDSVEIDPLLEDIIVSDPRVMPHVHLSLQSGDDMILKRMKRRHSRAQAVALVERLKGRRPDIAIGADIIAGFPTEEEEMFENSLKLLDDCDIVFGHIFPFSPRPGTPAARMPQTDRSVVKERAERLRAASAMRKARWLDSLVGTTQRVLFELEGRTGHAPNFASVTLDQTIAGGNMRGTMIDTRITGSDGHTLTGIPA